MFFFQNYMKKSLQLWIFRAFVIIFRKSNSQYCTFSNKNICWDHYCLRATLLQGKFCCWPLLATWSADFRESNHLAASEWNSTVKLKSLHNKNSLHYMSIFQHARVHSNDVKAMWRYLGNSNTSREISFKQKPRSRRHLDYFRHNSKQ